MSTPLSLLDLKLKLASFGALRPEVWTKLSARLNQVDLKVNESFSREIGTVVYITKGLLKEYDARHRKKPAIVNFISAGNFLVTTKHNQSKYLKAIRPTNLAYVDFDTLAYLFFKYNELYAIYNGIANNYEEGITFRQLVLEKPTATDKITLFIKKYRPILSMLKKGDIANYINTDYNYFIRVYGKLL